MNADELCAWLREGRESQREKLASIEQHFTMIRALYDDDHARVLREIKKRLGSPKLAAELAAVVVSLADHPANPRPFPPSQPPEPAPEMLAPEALHAMQLAAAIVDDPRAPESYAGFGAWLEEQGDPRGKLVAIGRELANRPGDASLLAAHAAHLAAHPAILGKVATCPEVVTELEWFMGFIRSARVAYTNDEVGYQPTVTLAQALGWLLDEPGAGRFLQQLVLGVTSFDEDHKLAGVVEVLARKRRTLRTLFIGDFPHRQSELSWCHLGNLQELWPAVPDLRELTLRAGSMALGTIHLPRLEALTVITTALGRASLASIAAADWPALHTLSLHIGERERGAARDLTALAPLLAGERVPVLRTLGIRNCGVIDEALVLLADAAVLPRLTTLDVSLGTMSSEGVAAIVRRADKFAHLELRVDDNYLPAEAEAQLRACVRQLSFGVQRAEDAGKRYVSVAE